MVLPAVDAYDELRSGTGAQAPVNEARLPSVQRLGLVVLHDALEKDLAVLVGKQQQGPAVNPPRIGTEDRGKRTAGIKEGGYRRHTSDRRRSSPPSR